LENAVQKFADDAADMEARAKAADVPFVAVYIPNRAQTAMIRWATAGGF